MWKGDRLDMNQLKRTGNIDVWDQNVSNQAIRNPAVGGQKPSSKEPGTQLDGDQVYGTQMYGTQLYGTGNPAVSVYGTQLYGTQIYGTGNPAEWDEAPRIMAVFNPDLAIRQAITSVHPNCNSTFYSPFTT